jgi:hypothetical protein
MISSTFLLEENHPTAIGHKPGVSGGLAGNQTLPDANTCRTSAAVPAK